jgi:WD40 repeat protein
MLRIEVRADGASAAVDGKTVCEFRGPMDRLSAPDTKAAHGLAIDSESPLWLISQTALHISSMKLTPLGPAATPVSATKPTASPSEPTASGRLGNAAASPLDALRHENIPAEDLQFAGLGDPTKVPAEVVAIVWAPPVNQQTADGFRSWQTGNSRAALSPDGRKLAFEVQSTKIVVRDLVAGPAADFTIDRLGAIKSVEFSPDGSVIFTGMTDGGIRVLDAADGKLLKTFGENRTKSGAEFKGMTVGPDGKTVVAGYGKGAEQVVLWDVATGEERVLVEGLTQPVFAYSPDGRYVATTVGGGTGKLQTWDTVTGREVAVSDKNHANSLAWSADGTTLAVANGDKGIKLWNTETKEPGVRLLAENNSLICFAPDGRTLAAADHGQVDLWNSATGELVRTFTLGPPDGKFNSLAFDATGRYLVTGNGNGTAYVLRLSDPPTPKEQP